MAKLDVVGIVTADMAAALRFYRDLGIAVPEGVDAEDHVDAYLPGGIRLSFDTIALMKQINPAFETGYGHKMSLAFLCDNPADVDATYQRLVDAGAPSVKSPYDAFWGQRYATVHDPDDNQVDLFAPLG